MARSNSTSDPDQDRLLILIKNIYMYVYTLWSRKRFLLPVTCFPTNLVYPFTLRAKDYLSVRSLGVTRENAIVDGLDYQIPVARKNDIVEFIRTDGQTTGGQTGMARSRTDEHG